MAKMGGFQVRNLQTSSGLPPILGGALSKVFSSRRPEPAEPAEPAWWSRGGSVVHWVGHVGHVVAVVLLDGWILFLAKIRLMFLVS